MKGTSRTYIADSSVCVRSPFLATATMLVGIKGEDGPTRSDLQLKLQEHAEKIGASLSGTD